MARQINDYPLLVDVDKGELLASFRSAQTMPAKEVIQGDTLRLLVRAVRSHPQAQAGLTQLWQDVTLPDQIYVGIGIVGRAPTSGTFTLTFGADTTSALAYNATAVQVAAALNALASVVSAGGVTVTGDDGGPWQVVFTSAGSRASITANVDALYPIAQANIYTSREGTVDLTEIQVVAMECQPAALASTFEDFPAAAVTIAELQTGASGVPAVQRISINDDAYAGTFTLSFDGASSGAIPYDATADDLLAFLEAISTIGTDNVSVTGQSPEWTVTFQGDLTGDQPAFTGSAAGLSVPVGKMGTINLATAGMEQLLDGEATVEATLEVQCMYGGTDAVTILQTPVTVANDQLANSPGAPIDLPSYLTVTAANDRFVRYDAAQTLSEPALAQAQANLDLGDLATLDAVATAQIASDAVTTAKVLDANITAAKLASDSVTTAKVLDANITAAKLASDSVTTAKVLDANITAAKLSSDSVTTAKVLDGAITAAKLADILTAATKRVWSLVYNAKGQITAAVDRPQASSPGFSTSASTADAEGVTLTIPAGTLAVGDVIEFELIGTTSNSTTASTLQAWVKVNGTKSIAATVAMGTTAAAGNGLHMRGFLRVAALTGSNNIEGGFSVLWKTSQLYSTSNTWTVNLNTNALTVVPGFNFTVAGGTSLVIDAAFAAVK